MPHAGGDYLIVNAGSDAWNYQVHELAKRWPRRFRAPRCRSTSAAPPDKRSYRVDFRMFRSLAPAHQPQAALLGTIDALRSGLAAMHFHDQDFRDSSFMRLRVLADLSVAWVCLSATLGVDRQASGRAPELIRSFRPTRGSRTWRETRSHR